MNPENFTYNGVTVSYSDAQKAIVIADQNLIAQLQNNLREQQNAFSYQEGQINDTKAHLDSDCNNLSGYGGNSSPRQKCIDKYNLQWTEASTSKDTINGYIVTINSQIASATKKLNDDIITIENDIKLQIQAQQSNTTAVNAPAVIQSNLITTQTQLANDATNAKLKQEQTVKIVGFVLVAVVLITIGYFIFKKVLS